MHGLNRSHLLAKYLDSAGDFVRQTFHKILILIFHARYGLADSIVAMGLT